MNLGKGLKLTDLYFLRNSVRCGTLTKEMWQLGVGGRDVEKSGAGVLELVEFNGK